MKCISDRKLELLAQNLEGSRMSLARGLKTVKIDIEKVDDMDAGEIEGYLADIGIERCTECDTWSDGCKPGPDRSNICPVCGGLDDDS